MSNFLESKFRNMAVLLLVFGLAGQENNLAPGQDGNPFQANSKAQDEDPFAANTSAADENPFGKKTASNENPFGRRVVKEDPFASNKGQNSRQVDAKLLQQLTVYKNQIAALEHENDHLKRAVDLYKQLQQSATQSHQHLLMRLLESPEQTLQTIALEALAQHDGKTRLPGEIDERLMELANSGAPGVKELALKWLARYEPASGVLRYANAGHPLPYLLEPGKAAAPLGGKGGVILGVDETLDYPVSQLVLEPRQSVVFYTDGISEARGESPEDFSRAGLQTTLTGLSDKEPAEVCEMLMASAAEFAGGTTHDDMCCLALRRIV